MCLLGAMLLVLVACGGGGPASNQIVGPVVSVRLEALIDGTTTVVDPTNIFVNEHVQLRLTGVDTGTVGQPRVVLPTNNWSMTGFPGGSLTVAGLFTADASPTGNFGSVNVTYDGNSYTSPIRVVAPAAVIAGRGRFTNGAPAIGVEIDALNSSGTKVATGLVGGDGTIRMSVPTTAVKFSATFPNSSYVRQFAYNGLNYSTLVAGCTAPLPSLTNGVTSNLLTNVVFYSTFDASPPPPPDGCN